MLLSTLGNAGIFTVHQLAVSSPNQGASSTLNPSQVSDWSQFQGGPFHNGYSTWPGPTTDHQVWNSSTGNSETGLLIANRTLIASVPDQTKCCVYGLNGTTGSVIYTASDAHTLGGDLTTIATFYPATGGGLTFFESYCNFCFFSEGPWLNAANSTSGSGAWVLGSPASPAKSPTYGWGFTAYYNQSVFYVLHDTSTLYSYASKSGTLQWQRTGLSYVATIPTIGDGVLVVGSDLNDNLTALSLVTGALSWSFKADGNIVGSPAYSNGLFYFGTSVGTIYAVTGQGAQVWSSHIGGTVTATPTVTANQLFIGSSNNYTYALSTIDGSQLWKSAADGPILTSAAVSSNNIVYEGSQTSTVYALDSSTGNPIWTHRLRGAPRPGFAISGGFLYASDSTGEIYAFATQDFSMVATANSLTVTTGGSENLTIALNSISGFAGNVSLAVCCEFTTGISPSIVKLNPFGTNSTVLKMNVSPTASPGNYSLTVTGSSTVAGLSISHTLTLVITVPQTGGGLYGQYWGGSFYGTPLSGCTLHYTPIIPIAGPSLAEIDPTINFATTASFNWHPFGYGEFSVKWTGEIRIPVGGTYQFQVSSDDGSWLFIDSVLALNRGGGASPPSTATVSLSAGLHVMELDFYETCAGSSGVDFSWLPPGATSFAIVPAAVLVPSAPVPNVILTVAVTNSTNAPISGATVAAAAVIGGAGNSSVTDSAGLAQMLLPIGSYNVTATAPGYLSDSQTANLISNESVTLTLARPFVFLGQIPSSHMTVLQVTGGYNISLTNMFSSSSSDVFFDWKFVGTLSTNSPSTFFFDHLPNLVVEAASRGSIDYPDAWSAQPLPVVLPPTTGQEGALMPELLPYVASSIFVNPYPPSLGGNTTIAVILHNPFNRTLSISRIEFDVGGLNVAGFFSSVGFLSNVTLSVNETSPFSVNWIATISGHHCVRVVLTYPATAQTTQSTQATQRNIDIETGMLAGSTGQVSFSIVNPYPTGQQITLKTLAQLPSGWSSTLDANGLVSNGTSDISLNLSPGARVNGLLTIKSNPNTGGTAIVDIQGYISGHLVGGIRKTMTATATNFVSISATCVSGLSIDIQGIAAPISKLTGIVSSWGDGQTSSGSFPFSHTFTSSGTFTATFTASYNDGTTASASDSVIVGPNIMSGCIQVSIASGIGGSVQFSTSSGIASGNVHAGAPVVVNAAQGDTVSLTANPASGYSFSSWTITSGLAGLGRQPPNPSLQTLLVSVSTSGGVLANFIQTPIRQVFAIVFNETGLPLGTQWNVLLNGVNESSVGSSITFSEANGTYSYEIGTIPGFVATVQVAGVVVAGHDVEVSVSFVSAGSSKVPYVDFKDNFFSDTSLDTHKWAIDSPVLQTIANYELSSGLAGTNIAVLGNTNGGFHDPTFSPSGMDWSAETSGDIEGVTTQSQFTPPFTLQVVATATTSNNAIAVFLSNTDGTKIFGIILNNQVWIQNQGQLTNSGDPSVFSESSETLYQILVNVNLTKISVIVTGGGQTYRYSGILGQVSNEGLYVSIGSSTAALKGQATPTCCAASAVFRSLNITSTATWSISVAITGELLDATGRPTGNFAPVQNAPLNFTNIVTSSIMLGPLSNDGTVVLNGIHTGSYYVGVVDTQPKDAETLTNSTLLVVGDPSNPTQTQLSIVILLKIPALQPLAVTVDSLGTTSGMYPLSVDLVSNPTGWAGNYQTQWLVNGTAPPKQDGDSVNYYCTPDAPAGATATCVFKEAGSFEVTANVTSSGTWFGVAEASTNTFSNSTTVAANNHPWNATLDSPSGCNCISVTYNGVAPNHAILTIENGLVYLNTTIADNYKTPVDLIPPILQAILGITAPYYGLILADSAGTVNPIAVYQNGWALNRSWVMPTGTPTTVPLDSTSSCGTPNGLHCYSFDVRLSPTNVWAALGDAVTVLLDSLGVANAVKGLLGAKIVAFKQALIDALVEFFKTTFVQLGFQFDVNKILQQDPASLGQLLLGFMVKLVWALIASLPYMLTKLAIKEVLNLLGPSAAGLAVTIGTAIGTAVGTFIAKVAVGFAWLQFAIDIASIVGAIVVGDVVQTFRIASLEPMKSVTVKKVSPSPFAVSLASMSSVATSAIPNVELTDGTQTFGWQGGWVSIGGSMVHSYFTPSLYSFAVSGGNQTLTIETPSGVSSMNYDVTLSFGGSSRELTGSITSSSPATFSVEIVNGTMSVTPLSAVPSIRSTVVPGSVLVGMSASDIASVSGISGFAPTGFVQYTVYSDTACTSAIFNDTEPLGVVSSAFTPSAAGNYQWVAKYLGDTSYNPVSTLCGAEPLQVTDFRINPSVASLTVLAGQTGTSSIIVSPINGFTGTVILRASPSSGLVANLSLISITGGSGISTLSLSSLTAGNYTVTVTGTSGFDSHTMIILVQVVDFQIFSGLSIVNTIPGVAGVSSITVTAVNGFIGTVSLTTSIFPLTGLACAVSPTSVPGGSGISTLSCTGIGGTYSIIVRGTSTALVHSITVTVNVADFTFTAAPSSVTVPQGPPGGTSTITVTSVGGFSGTVDLTSNAPVRFFTTFSPTSVIMSGTSMLMIDVSSPTTPGSYLVNVTGTSGNLSHTVTLHVTVTSAISVIPPVFTQSTWEHRFSLSKYNNIQNWRFGVQNNSTSTTIYFSVTITGIDRSGTNSFTLTTPVFSEAPQKNMVNLSLSRTFTSSQIGDTFSFAMVIHWGTEATTDPSKLAFTSTLSEQGALTRGSFTILQ